MDQMNLLWAYQAEDMKADRLEREIRRSPVRQKMEKDRTLYLEKQQLHKKIEEKVASLQDRKDGIVDALKRAKDQLDALQSRYDAAPPTDLDGIRAMMGEVSRCLSTISHYEDELGKMGKEVQDSDKRADAIRRDALRLRTEFEQLKAQYEAEMPAKKAALDAQRALAEEKKAEISEVLLRQYLEVKKHIVPPLAMLNHDQCSGCNTSLPSALLHSVRNAGDTLVKCDSCGRLIVKL